MARRVKYTYLTVVIPTSMPAVMTWKPVSCDCSCGSTRPMGRGGAIPDKLGSPLPSCGVSMSLLSFSPSPSVFLGCKPEDLEFVLERALDLALRRPAAGGLN
jgi:hypothetical protein